MINNDLGGIGTTVIASKFTNIEYNSILLMEIIKIEDYEQLIEDLKDLFLNLDSMDYLRVQKAEELIKNQNKQIFRDSHVILPFISHSKFIGSILPSNRVFFDLGDHVDHVQISIHNFSPSYILLDLRCLLNQEVSNRLNLIINGVYQPIVKQQTNSKGTYKEYINSERLKEEEISDLRYLIKKEMIEFFVDHFDGKFMESSIEKNDYSIVPSIDIFSLDFPIDNLEEWCKTNEKLFNMFSIIFSASRTFQYERYLFFKEDRSTKNNLNYLIFARNFETKEEKSKKTEEQQKNSELNPENVNIINGLIRCPFSLIAVEREVECEVSSINEINNIVLKEMSNLKKEDIKDLLKRRETMFKGIFEFERFKMETVSYLNNISFCDFVSLKNSQKFFDILKKSITTKLEFIEIITLKYSKQSQSNLELKNIDYNRKSQKRIFWLTVVVGFLTFIQVLGLLKSTNLSSFLPILNIFFIHVMLFFKILKLLLLIFW